MYIIVSTENQSGVLWVQTIKLKTIV
jgi:hypothetical protein